jgi:hemolysin III
MLTDIEIQSTASGRLGKTVEHTIQHLREELANSLTHGFGLLLAIAGLVVLVVVAALGGDVMQIVSFSVFGATMVILYLASTVYHSVRHPRFKRFMRFVDHAAIYLLIAGTYTPFLLLNMRHSVGWLMFAIVWAFAIIGILVKGLHMESNVFLTPLLYIFMGWICLFALKPAMEAIHPAGLLMLLAGGIAYTGGVVFYVLERMPYNHAIWHGFVMGGTAIHYFAVIFYAATPAV